MKHLILNKVIQDNYATKINLNEICNFFFSKKVYGNIQKKDWFIVIKPFKRKDKSFTIVSYDKLKSLFDLKMRTFKPKPSDLYSSNMKIEILKEIIKNFNNYPEDYYYEKNEIFNNQ